MSKKIFVIQRNDGAFFGKKGEWVTSDCSKELLCQSYYDQALNVLIELNLGDPTLRAHVRELEEAEFR